MGHNWGVGVITTEPTTDAEGVKTYTCSICGAKETEVVPKVSASKLRWDRDSAGVLTWDPESGVKNYTVKIKNSEGNVVGASSVNTTKCNLWLDICNTNKWMKTGGVYSIEVVALDSSWREAEAVGTLENAINLAVAGSVDYTHEVNGKSYTVTLEQGAPTGSCYVRWTIGTNSSTNANSPFAVNESNSTCNGKVYWDFSDGATIDVRIVTSSRMSGDTWTLAAMPIVTKTYQAA